MEERKPLELWGGVECTVARIGEEYRDQNIETGHHGRVDDLDAIAALGIRTLRYPVIWETISPSASTEPDWSWHDERLHRLQDLGIEPIATLCHHGSGPRHTHLLDPAFPELLAGHAASVAKRYPWIRLYTPINEPLTTARFSALYGHWYPHRRDYGAFLQALVNECHATVLAMRAIRTVRSDAGLVQTEDVGKTFSTPMLAYQAEHDNDRRWLTFDLLCGRVEPQHAMWSFLTDWAKIDPADLAIFEPADATPDIIGINHYLTSDRFLDQRLRRYTEHHWGGNSRHRFADAEAIRVELPAREIGPAARLRETWQRYKRPIAITEVHHGCTRDEQLRWLMDVWSAAVKVRAEGVDVRALTVWSMFGAVDWNSLLTQRSGVYEPGIFDIRGPAPRRTALADAAQALAATGTFQHPVLHGPGWWQRNTRFYRQSKNPSSSRVTRTARPILISGAASALGRAFSRICEVRGLDHILISGQEMDGADKLAIEAAFSGHKPWAVIDAVGLMQTADVEAELKPCEGKVALRSKLLAQACAASGIPFVAFSSELVFDGCKGTSYTESDPVNPVCARGRAAAQAERRVLERHDNALVVRASALFGPWDEGSFIAEVLASLAAGHTIKASADVVSPTYTPDLVHVVLDLLIDGATGIWHLPSPGALSWIDFASAVARQAELDPELITNVDGPKRNISLTSERGLLLPPLETTVERFVSTAERFRASGAA